MNCIAHIIRMSDDNVVKKVLQFKVTRIRKRGRLRLIAEISTWRMVSKYSSLTIGKFLSGFFFAIYLICFYEALSGCAEDDILLVPFEIDKFDVHDECVKKVLDHFQQIDILVNNAGISQRADFADIDIDVDQNLFNVNVFGTVNLSRKVLKHFLERKKGHFVVTSSIAGKLGNFYT
ncbi:UNVERIFIED_CONTAM: Dhrs7 [Trichonephila clavipes]